MGTTTIALWLGLVACKGGGDTDGGDAAMTEGSIEFASDTLGPGTASVPIRKAFAMAVNGRGMLYGASSAAATCAAVAEYLTTEDPYDPSELFEPEACNFLLVFDYDGSYDGREVGATDSINLACTVDPGAWELDDPNGYEDYYWSGRYFSGAPTTYTMTLSGAEADGAMALDVAMSEYTGSYTQDAMEQITGTGEVTGAIEATWCTELAQTPFF